jgi:calcineurin-like phosphoesterase
MTGAMDSVLGVKKELAIQKMMTYMPVRFENAVENPQLNGVVLTIDLKTQTALHIIRLRQPLPSE